MNAPAPVVIKYQGSGDSAVNANQMLPCCCPVSFFRTTGSSWLLGCERGELCQHITKKTGKKELLLSSDINEIQYVIWKRKLGWMGCLVSCMDVWLGGNQRCYHNLQIVLVSWLWLVVPFFDVKIDLLKGKFPTRSNVCILSLVCSVFSPFI